jgi:O-antigen ligase
MLMVLPLTLVDIRDPLLKLGRWLLKWGQIPFASVLGLILGKVMLAPARDLIISILGIFVHFMTIVVNPLGGLMLWSVTYPFTTTAVNIPMGNYIPDLTPMRFCFAFLTAMLLAQAATGRRSFPRLRGAEIAALLFVVGMALSAPAAADPVRAMQVIIDAYLFPVLAYFLARNLVLDRRGLERLFSAFLVIGAYTAAYAIYEQLTGNILFVEVQSWWVDSQRSEAEHIRVLRGLWGDDNAFGLFLGLTLPIAFHRFIKAPTLGKKAGYGVLSVLLLGGEFATFKRAAWLSLIISFFIIQLFHSEFRRIFLVLVVIFGVVMLLFGDQIAESEVGARTTHKLDSANGRTERWTTAIDLWKQKPITGYGYKRFDDLSSLRAVESFYLHILVSAGLIAFVPFVTFILLTVKDSIAIFCQVPRNPRLFVDRQVVALFWGMLAAYLVISFSNYMAKPINHILTYMLIGGIVGSQGALLEHKRRARPVILDREAL